jgi:hypothetical protein
MPAKPHRSKPTSIVSLLARFVVGTLVWGVGGYFAKGKRLGMSLAGTIAVCGVVLGVALIAGAIAERVDWPKPFQPPEYDRTAHEGQEVGRWHLTARRATERHVRRAGRGDRE